MIRATGQVQGLGIPQHGRVVWLSRHFSWLQSRGHSTCVRMSPASICAHSSADDPPTTSFTTSEPESEGRAVSIDTASRKFSLLNSCLEILSAKNAAREGKIADRGLVIHATRATQQNPAVHRGAAAALARVPQGRCSASGVRCSISSTGAPFLHNRGESGRGGGRFEAKEHGDITVCALPEDDAHPCELLLISEVHSSMWLARRRPPIRMMPRPLALEIPHGSVAPSRCDTLCCSGRKTTPPEPSLPFKLYSPPPQGRLDGCDDRVPPRNQNTLCPDLWMADLLQIQRWSLMLSPLTPAASSVVSSQGLGK